MSNGVNPYSPPGESAFAMRKPFRWMSACRNTAVFVVSWVVGIHIVSFYDFGFSLHDFLTSYAFLGDRWAWNLLVRLPCLALIQLFLLVGYAKLRGQRGMIGADVRIRFMMLLGLGTTVFRSEAYQAIRKVGESVFGLTMTWTPHYVITWIAYGVTTLAVAETVVWFSLRIKRTSDG